MNYKSHKLNKVKWSHMVEEMDLTATLQYNGFLELVMKSYAMTSCVVHHNGFLEICASIMCGNLFKQLQFGGLMV